MSLKNAYQKIIDFLNKNKIDYLVIGGIPASLYGEPRFTADIDICLFVKKRKIKEFLEKLKREGFEFEEKKVKERIKFTETFRVYYKETPIDFIIASTPFEREAIKRKKIVKFQNVKANFPSLEDFILFKIITLREKDLWDAKNVVIRYKDKLGRRYLEKWAKVFCEEAESLKIWNNLQRLFE
jgi:predicted nucleotidyltransferase